MSRDDIEKYVVELAQTFSGAPRPGLDAHVYRDLGISGGDAVEFYKKIEGHFGVDIRPVTELSFDIRAGWFRKAHRKIAARDPSLREISSLIAIKRS